MEVLSAAFAYLTDAQVWAVACVGLAVGLTFGILPGLSGVTTLAILLPFVYGMDPVIGLAFLLSAHAAVYTGGAVTTILLGIPGTPANAATLADGKALAERGRGSYAVGSALAASALGGVLGAGVLVALLPLLQPVVLAFGAPEIFLLGLIGVTYIAVLGQGAPWKGLLAAGLGMFLALFGYQRISGVPRFWMDIDYLLDGIRLIPLVLGLFAVPEILAQLRERTLAATPSAAPTHWADMGRGAAAVLNRPLLFLRSALIGVFVGVVPGIGGETAPFLAHAMAKRRSRAPGTAEGLIEGVIAPESSNNAKEGGALVPTLALGVPGSSGMALLLGGFILLGFEPGPSFLESHLDIAALLAVLLAGTNVVAAALMVPLAVIVARMARVEGRHLGPALLALVVTGAYASGGSLIDVGFVFAFGVLGVIMKRLDYSRPALVLGFVLGPIVETYFFITLQAYGPAFLARPLSVALLLMLVAAIVWAAARTSAKRTPGKPGT